MPESSTAAALRMRGHKQQRSADPAALLESFINDEEAARDKGLPIQEVRQAYSMWKYTFKSTRSYCGVHLISALAVGSSVLTIQVTKHSITPLVTVASILTIGFSIILILQHGKLKHAGTLRTQNNVLRKKVHYMRQERERLHRTLDRMDETLAELHHIPQELHKISWNNKNIDRLLAVVKEKGEIQEQMRERINQSILQQIIQVIVRADRDGNWTLRPMEIEAMIVRLGMVEGVEFHEQRFRQLVQADPTVSTIMRVIRSLMERDDEFQHASPIFVVKQQ
jgi:DNA-binding transcriptional MerR regulator